MQLFNTKVIPSTADALWSMSGPLPDLAGKKLLVITTPFAPGSAEEGTLEKMMAACKLSATDYSVLQMDSEAHYAWQAIVGAGAPKAVLLLGISPAALSIHARLRLHAPNAFGGHTIVPALSLSEIEANPAAKKSLWTDGLKVLFGL